MFEHKDEYTFSDLLEIVRLLRAPGGCPWDREQNLMSMRPNILEEAYELVEAINREHEASTAEEQQAAQDNLIEEMGDVLLQIVMMTEIVREGRGFGLKEVVDRLAKKLVRRHSHVFGKVEAKSSEAALANWEREKNREQKTKSLTEKMATVPRAFPALKRSQKLQKYAAAWNFDWDRPEPVFEKLDEEIAELKEAYQGGRPEEITGEVGDCLMVLANLARHLKTDAELALDLSNQKFLRRLAQMEALMREDGLAAGPFDTEVTALYYERVKEAEHQAQTGSQSQQRGAPDALR